MPKKKSKRASNQVYVTELQARVFILHFLYNLSHSSVEAKKRSLKLLKNRSHELKQATKALQKEFAVLEPKQYQAMTALIEKAEEINARIEASHQKQVAFENSLSIDLDSKIMAQRAHIAELYASLQSAQENYEKICISQLKFENYIEEENTPAVFEAEVKALRSEYERVRDKRADMIAKLYEKHDHSLRVTEKRAEMIIAEAETVAAQSHINTLSESAINVMELNKVLKERVSQVFKEYAHTSSIVERLEDDNRELFKRNVGVDWNLNIWNKDEGYEIQDSDEEDDEECQRELLDLEWIPNFVPEQEEEFPEVFETEEEKYARLRDTARSNSIKRPQHEKHKQERDFINYSQPISVRSRIKQSKPKLARFDISKYTGIKADSVQQAVRDFMQADADSRDLLSTTSNVEVAISGKFMRLIPIDGKTDGGQWFRGSLKSTQ